MTCQFRVVRNVMLALVISMSMFSTLFTESAQGGTGAFITFMPAVVHQFPDQLPDLAMAKVTGLSISYENERRVLRFSTTIVNIGSGPFEVLGSREDTSVELMDSTQRIYHTGGGYRDIGTPAKMVFAGDGHTHWHLKDLETYELFQLDNNNRVAVGNKVGYCFFDNIEFMLNLPGAPANPVYLSCGGMRSLSIVTGLSVGWGDKYPAALPGQDLDITGLPAGVYRLLITSDQANLFLESNENNNFTWVDIQLLSADGLDYKVIGYGPGA